MARREYVCYELVNPIITSFNHNKLEYSQQGIHDFDMKLLYEAVSYSVGNVADGEVEGFAQEHYDTFPSPLTGQLDPNTIMPSFTDNAGIQASQASLLNTVITQINTAQNTKQPGVSAITNATTAISASQVSLNTNIQAQLSNTAGSKVVNTLNGLQGFAFPFLG